MQYSIGAHGSFNENPHDPRTKVEKLQTQLEFLMAENRAMTREIESLKFIIREMYLENEKLKGQP